jgi:hypothetical protein
LAGLAEYENYVAEQVPVIWMSNFRIPIGGGHEQFPGRVKPISSSGPIPRKDWHYVKDRVRLRLRIANDGERKGSRY